MSYYGRLMKGQLDSYEKNGRTKKTLTLLAFIIRNNQSEFLQFFCQLHLAG